MSGLLIFIIVLVIIYCSISWVLPKVLSILFERKFSIVLRIGRIGIPYLKLCDVNISKKGFTIHVEEISIQSSFLNSEITKLITLVVKDVRINKDIGCENEKFNTFQEETIDFRGKKIPHFITTFAQFMAVHVYNISAMLLRSELPGWLIHATASELHLDGSIVQNSKTLLVNANLSETSAKILKHAEKDIGDKTCLGELSFAIALEATLVAQGPLSFESLTVGMSHTKALIYEGFYSMAQGNNKDNSSNRSRYDENIFNKFLPIIPKNLNIKIADTSLRSVKENSRTDFHSSLQVFQLNTRFLNVNNELKENYLPHMFLSFHLSNLEIENIREKILVLNFLKLDSRCENKVVNFKLLLDTLMLTYNHDTIHKWLYTNFMNREKTLLIVDKSLKKISNNETLLENVLKEFIINGMAELRQVSALTILKENVSSIGFSHSKLFLQQSSDTRDYFYEAHLPNMLFANRHWHTEILIESFWWSFNEWTEPPLVPKNLHVWETPIFLGMLLFKMGTVDENETKLETLLDTLKLEWCLHVGDYIILALRCLKQYNLMQSSEESKALRRKQNANITINFKLTHMNVFILSPNDEYIVLRLNTLSIIQNLKLINIRTDGVKITTSKGQSFYKCICTEDMANYKASISKAQLDLSRNEEDLEISLKLLDEVTVYWCPNVHLKALTFLREIDDFVNGLKETLNWKKSNVKAKQTNNCKLHIFGLFNFYIKISNIHLAKISLDELNFSNSKSNFTLSNNTVIISIDGSDIFTIEGLQLIQIHDHPIIKEERLDYENFALPWNKTWGLTINLFKACFPYEHNYADAIQNEFISVFKWLRIVHSDNKMQFSEKLPLPSDLLINVREFLFEMSDDPFEVKLRDNFELLLDECNENLKRQKMLKDKLDELCMTHLHLPAGKVEELFANLSKKNAEIYVQRSQKMYKTSPPRTRLFAWTITNMELIILADPSIHGTNNVIRIMREIDAESPWPEEGIEFSTLWCRAISLRCQEWKFLLRDFPQPLLDIRQCYISGLLVGAEQLAPRRARRDVIVELGPPWGSATIERAMLPLKFYHDFNCEIEYYSYAFGPCWEPVIAQCNLSFEKISAPSRDPSPSLSFWDKMRLLFHGRLTMVVQQLKVLLHASLDPYNTTEEMELTWNQVIMDWTNAKFVYKGDLNIFVRTASKYDDCQLLHLPNLKLIVNLKWISLGDPNDHHSVILCAPDKIPEYSSNQVHDSFRAFRSQNVNLSIVLETRPMQNQSPTSNLDSPTLLLYGSTLRWFENLKLILSGVTRPTRRGQIFKNVRPRKIQLSRHYRKIRLLIGLHKFQVCYWMSFAMQKGCELLGGKLSSSSEHMLSLIPTDDNLIHRPKAEWSVMYMNSELYDSEIWLKSALQGDSDTETVAFRQPVEKCYCLSVAKVSYGREAIVINRDHSSTEKSKDTPTHRLVVYDLKGAWTKSNRNVAFALFDTFMKNKQMKKNLSTEALKSFRKESNTTPLKRRNTEAPGTPPNASSLQVLQTTTGVQDTPSPLSKLQSGHAANMLQQLIAEAENKAVVFSDDLSSATRQQHLQGLQACQEDDVQHKNWLIALVNAQVLLKGSETKGYVILSAAKAEILQRIHRPVWKERTLVSKTTWVGTLECLQYYATVNAGDNDSLNENIMWLTVDNIQEKESTVISEIPQLPNMVGSGVSVGAVVSDTVGAVSVGENSPLQLQRIVSRCKCEFFYVGYGDSSVDLGAVAEVPPPPQEDVGPWDRCQTAVDAFTLMYHDLDVCTNSLQYAMLLDIVNNLILYVEPHKKEALERLARMRFKIQLHSVEDQRRPIQVLQTQVRWTMSKLRRLEKETYFISKAYAEDQNDFELAKEMERLENLVYECKNQLNTQSESLDMMLSCYKESQLLATSRLATTRNDKPLTIVRANEICFKHAQWRLTEADGQIGIADLVLSNFLYTKNSKSDDSVEHLLELGYLRMTNLLPNQIYKEVMCPTEIQSNMPVEHKRVVRVFCREKPRVGGISVKEHFEINVVPLTIGLTKKFYNTMLKFCFPERDTENIDTERGEEIDENSRGKKNRSSGKRSRDSNFYVHIDDVEKMKERAEKNKLFIYIKIPEVPVRLSYKGNKEKNLEDIRDFSLVIPTLEYHNVTWTWLDLLMAIRSDSRKVILSQAIKQKLQFKRNIGSSDESSSPHEEDKARMLFGTRHTSEPKVTKKGVGGILKFSK